MKALPAVALLGLALSQPVLAQNAEADTYAVNNAISALYHEMGHLFVDQFELAILGGEEGVADAIATLMLLEDGPGAEQISIDTVDGYLRSSELYGEADGDNVDFNDEHGLDVQRAFQMTCLLVGASPEAFGEVADEVGLDAVRQDACADEYGLARRGWGRMMAAHKARAGQDTPFTVVYDRAEDRYAPMENLLKSEQVLEAVADRVAASFRLVRPATLRATSCGEENAFYDPEADEITLCYEYVQFYYDLIANPDQAGMEHEG
jgi:hypothetical protein